MTKKIYKYEIINLTDAETVLQIPGYGKILKVDRQPGNGEKIFVWIMVDIHQDFYERSFCVYGTGHTLPKNIECEYGYLDTVVMPSGLVWHVFERF